MAGGGGGVRRAGRRGRGLALAAAVADTGIGAALPRSLHLPFAVPSKFYLWVQIKQNEHEQLKAYNS